MQTISYFERCRFDRQVDHVVSALGSRPVGELLIQIGTSANCLPLVLATLAAYADLTPAMMVAAHADRRPSHPLRVVA